MGQYRYSSCCEWKLLELQIWAIPSFHFGLFTHLPCGFLNNCNRSLEKRLRHGRCLLAHHFTPLLLFHLAAPELRNGLVSGIRAPPQLLICCCLLLPRTAKRGRDSLSRKRCGSIRISSRSTAQQLIFLRF